MASKLTFRNKSTEYIKEYCNEMIEFFDRKPFEEKKVMRYFKNGDSEEKIVFIPCELPILEGFASSLGVTVEILFKWAKEHTEFKHTMDICKTMQAHILITNGLKGLYNPTFTVFATKNIIGWTDKQDIKVSGVIQHKKLEEFLTNKSNVVELKKKSDN